MERAGSSSRGWTSALARRPAVGAAACFIGGIAGHAGLAHAPLAWIACAIVAGLLAITVFQRATLSRQITDLTAAQGKTRTERDELAARAAGHTTSSG